MGWLLLQVLTVRDILAYGVEDHMGARVELEEMAMKALRQAGAKGGCAATASPAGEIDVVLWAAVHSLECRSARPCCLEGGTVQLG